MASSSGNHDNARGSGFVHLNTPASIQYTAGQTLSLSELRQRKSRAECVVLPESVGVWRRAFQRYMKEEGYGSFAADIEDERSGNGVVLPPLVPQRSGPLRRRTGEALSTRDAFFNAPAGLSATSEATTAVPPSSAAPSASSPFSCPSPDSAQLAASAASETATAAASSPSGITIVSHHKIAGRQQFVYPDHDGVLSAGVVPQIVVTAEEKAEEEAAKAYYVSALDMSEEELAALEELQALWKNRARSHSFGGAQHRHIAQGSAAGQSESEADGGRAVKARRVEDTADSHGFAEAETAIDDASTLDKELAEALRLADELLRFA